jgi:nicotinate-nucleotide pyrophosphorylase (carboxylating)
VALNAGRAWLEASGGIGLDGIGAVAETGVDDISVRCLTKHVRIPGPVHAVRGRWRPAG